MRIKKTSQYIEGGASLSNVYGTSQSNGYTQEYINELNTYSTTEQRIGTYKEKPLYRKLFVGTSNNSTNSTSLISTGISKVINAGGWINLDNDYDLMINTSFGASGSNDARVIKDHEGITLQVGSPLYNKNYEIWVEYTKTTDTAQNTRSITSNDEVEEPIEDER